MKQLQLGDIVIDIEYKKIKNIYLRVYPPSGRVHISAPIKTDLDTIRVFALSKLKWIKRQQDKYRNQEREVPREYNSGEGCYYKGQRYLLEVVEVNSAPRVELKPDTLILYVRPNTPVAKRQAIIDEWYRAQLKMVLPEYIEKWEKILKVEVNQFATKKMKSKWGSCNIRARRIWLNLELAKKPPECLEYVVVHEMVHLLERSHNKRFYAYMDQYLPRWRIYKNELSRVPINQGT